jgi:hypothetical protein
MIRDPSQSKSKVHEAAIVNIDDKNAEVFLWLAEKLVGVLKMLM